MPTTSSAMFPPPLKGQAVASDSPLGKWLLAIQNMTQLKTVDTSAGNYSETLPQAGVTANGQSNQNQELVYKKVSADGNTFTLHGAAEGDQTLTAQYSSFRVRSDGNKWWLV